MDSDALTAEESTVILMFSFPRSILAHRGGPGDAHPGAWCQNLNVNKSMNPLAVRKPIGVFKE
jgi:hypothetical protein